MNLPARTAAAPHIVDLLGRAEARCHVQLVTAAGTRETSFDEIWKLSTRLAGVMQRDASKGRVAGMLTPSVETIASFVGALRAGRDFVSLPLPGRGQDLSAYAEQLAAIIDAGKVGALVIEAAYAPLLRSLPIELPCPILVSEEVAQTVAGALHGEPEPGEIIQFSSGTTGRAKGIRLSGTAIAASVSATLDALEVGGAPESFCSWLPLSHDMGLIGGLLGSWVGCSRTRPGYRYTCLSPELFLARPLVWLETCAAIGGTVTAGPTFAYHVLSRHLERRAALDLSKLRACIVGAEPIGADTLTAFAAAGSRHGLHEMALCPAYGLAEMCLAVSMVRPDEAWSTRTLSVDGRSGSFVSCGRTLDGVNVDAPSIAAGAGPVRVSGSVACAGYIPDQKGIEDGWIDTGDLGAVDGRELVVTGRFDDIVCVAGRNLFAWELERTAATVPGVRPGGCAVLADGHGRYVVLFESSVTDPGGLQETLVEVRRRLATVAGVGPSGVGCLPRGVVAKTPSGKIRRSYMATELRRLVDSCLAYRES
jgi:acyl-CoA synthetase (AMP-forming)/AMP-acid ligase II